MKKLFICFLFFTQAGFSQHLFQKTYGNLLDDWLWSSEVVNDTDIYVVGYTRENDPMNNTILISLLNADGNVNWTKSLNIGESDAAFKISKLSNGTLLLTGETTDYIPPSDNDMLLINLDLLGNVLWKRNWGTNTHERLEKSLETTYSQILSIGYITYFGSNIWGGMKVVKSDLNGNIIWDKTKLFDESAYIIDIEMVNDNKYFVSGSTRQMSNSDYNILVAEMDSSGNINWAKGFGGSGDEGSTYISKMTENGILIATTSDSYTVQSGYGDIMVIRTDSLGNIIWSKVYGNIRNEYLKGIIPDTSGNHILYGYCDSFYPAFSGTAFAMKIDDNGDVIWSRLYGTNSSAYFFDGKQVHDQLIFSGQTKSPLTPSNLDGFLVATDWQGNSGCTDTSVSILYSDIIVNNYNITYHDTSQTYTENFSITNIPLAIGINVLCDSIIGINEDLVHNNLLIYPTPNNGNFFIKLPLNEAFQSLKLFNVLGQEICHVAKNVDSNLIALSLKNAFSGICFVSINCTNSKTYISKTLIR